MVVCVWIRAVVRARRTTRNNVTLGDVPRPRGQTYQKPGTVGERRLLSVLVSKLSVPNRFSSGTKLGTLHWYGIARVGVVNSRI